MIPSWVRDNWKFLVVTVVPVVAIGLSVYQDNRQDSYNQGRLEQHIEDLEKIELRTEAELIRLEDRVTTIEAGVSETKERTARIEGYLESQMKNTRR